MRLLAADWEPFIKIIVFLVVIGFSLISKLIGSIRKAAQNGQAQLPKVAPPVVERADQKQLHDEVEEFLRRAIQNKSSPPKAPEPPPATRVRPKIEPVAPPSKMFPMGGTPAPPPPPPRRRKKTPPPAPVVPAPVAEAPLSQRHISSRLEDHISSRNLEARVGSLANYEQEFDIQVAEGFNRAAGTMSSDRGTSSALGADGTSQPSSPVAADLSPAAQIAALLANPDSVRDAIVLNEILTRPTNRW